MNQPNQFILFVITGFCSLNRLEPTKSVHSVRYNRVSVITEFVITEFDCIIIIRWSKKRSCYTTLRSLIHDVFPSVTNCWPEVTSRTEKYLFILRHDNSYPRHFKKIICCHLCTLVVPGKIFYNIMVLLQILLFKLFYESN